MLLYAKVPYLIIKLNIRPVHHFDTPTAKACGILVVANGTVE